MSRHRRERVGTINLRDLQRRVPVGHDEGKGRGPKVHKDRRLRREQDRLRRDIEEQL